MPSIRQNLKRLQVTIQKADEFAAAGGIRAGAALFVKTGDVVSNHEPISMKEKPGNSVYAGRASSAYGIYE